MVVNRHPDRSPRSCFRKKALEAKWRDLAKQLHPGSIIEDPVSRIGYPVSSIFNQKR